VGSNCRNILHVEGEGSRFNYADDSIRWLITKYGIFSVHFMYLVLKVVQAKCMGA
jgi:hypothetical protein